MIYLAAKRRQVNIIHSPDFSRTGIARVRQHGVSYPDGCYNEVHFSLLNGNSGGVKEIEQAVKDARLAEEGW